jgi:hypothetical protein
MADLRLNQILEIESTLLQSLLTDQQPLKCMEGYQLGAMERDQHWSCWGTIPSWLSGVDTEKSLRNILEHCERMLNELSDHC